MRRKEVLENGGIYHVYNRTLNGLTLLPLTRDYDHAILAMWYFQQSHHMSLSDYLRLSPESQQQSLEQFKTLPHKVELLAFSLMPNHYHIVIKQLCDGGVSKFLADYQNCLTRYFNKKYHHQGPVFCSQFKAKPIENNSSFLHSCRYVIINPVMAYITDMNHLPNYPYTSLPEYLDTSIYPHKATNPEMLAGLFPDKLKFLVYLKNEIDYKRSCAELKYLLFDE